VVSVGFMAGTGRFDVIGHTERFSMDVRVFRHASPLGWHP
jgi:hypothetical protein